jgi:hypothetical protein
MTRIKRKIKDLAESGQRRLTSDQGKACPPQGF